VLEQESRAATTSNTRQLPTVTYKREPVSLAAGTQRCQQFAF